MIESVKFINRALLKVFILRQTHDIEYNHSCTPVENGPTLTGCYSEAVRRWFRKFEEGRARVLFSVNASTQTQAELLLVRSRWLHCNIIHEENLRQRLQLDAREGIYY
jgi:hypothetical protein